MKRKPRSALRSSAIYITHARKMQKSNLNDWNWHFHYAEIERSLMDSSSLACFQLSRSPGRTFRWHHRIFVGALIRRPVTPQSLLHRFSASPVPCPCPHPSFLLHVSSFFYIRQVDGNENSAFFTDEKWTRMNNKDAQDEMKHFCKKKVLQEKYFLDKLVEN